MNIHMVYRKIEDLPKQLADEPKDANFEWLRTHDPRVAVFKTGVDKNGIEIISYLVDGSQIRSHVWQDFVDGGNHERYPWIPAYHYWLDVANANILEYDYNLIHETVESRKMQEGLEYDDAHEHFANPAEYKARQSTHEEVIKMLEALGWEVPYVNLDI
jgi:hypothetical protein